VVGFKKEESEYLLNFLYDHIAKVRTTRYKIEHPSILNPMGLNFFPDSFFSSPRMPTFELSGKKAPLSFGTTGEFGHVD
jgi:hypothetical protein